MLKDVTLGQYFPGETSVHKLDPRTKLVLVIRTAGHHRGKYRPQDDQQSQNQEKCKLLMGKEEIFLFHRICSFARILGSTAP